jgi:hypothetical protein
MQTIVLMTRENSERVTHVSLFLYSKYSEAANFCYFVNHLSLVGGDKLAARVIIPSTEYPLEKYHPFNFDDLVKVDDRKIQRLMHELDSEVLATSLIGAKKEVKDVFFRNMSKRAAYMLEEDIEYIGPVTESDIENARRLTLDIYNGLPSKESKLNEAWEKYINLKENDTKEQTNPYNRDNIVLVFCGAKTVADYVSVYLFDEDENADNFCHYLSNLKPDKGFFVYAIHADQMIEYETTRPLLILFDQIFQDNRTIGEFSRNWIIREALKKFDTKTLLQAFKGMDKRSRMYILQSLPTKTTDEINEDIGDSDKNNGDLCSSRESRQAQQRIINAMNKTADKAKQCKYPFVAVLKD